VEASVRGRRSQLVEGRISSYSRGSGEGGAVAYSTAVDRVVLGAGATKRLVLGMTTPIYSEDLRASRVLVDLGLIVPRDIAIPFRLIVSMDGTTITREFKPQMRVEVEEGFYGKVIYDATALLSGKIVSKDVHRFTIVYTAARPIIFEDSGVAIVYDGIKGGWYSYNLLGGAMVIEPGDIVEMDIELPESRVENKSLILKMHVPSRHASIRVDVGGTILEAGGLVGPAVLEAPIRYRGRRVRVYFYYMKPEVKFYPRKAVISSLAIMENIVPQANLEVRDIKMEEAEGAPLISFTLANKGEGRAVGVQALVVSEGETLARRDIGRVESGEEVEVTLKLKKPPKGEALLRILWRGYGRVLHVDRRLKVS
jgi:hypothetical protein